MSKWSDIKMYDLSIPIGISTPPWPTYEPLQVKYFKRLAPNGANGQLVTHSNHVGNPIWMVHATLIQPEEILQP